FTARRTRRFRSLTPLLRRRLGPLQHQRRRLLLPLAGRLGMRTKPISSIEDEKRPSAGHHSGDGDWVDRETSASCFADLRLAHRFGKLLSQMSEQIGATVPMACQDWANTKAAYRFFDNDRVSEAEILAGHFVSTKKRLAGV